MGRNLAIGAVILAILVFIYFAWDGIAMIGTVAMTARDIYAPPKPAPVVAASSAPEIPLSDFALGFMDDLMVMDNGTTRDYDPRQLRKVRFYALYYSASWCGPCRAFTPNLVGFYNEFKPSHPSFELIFVNEDRSESDMEAYMRDDSMPWPAVRYSDIDGAGVMKYCGPYIPCLVLVDSQGNVLSDTIRNGQYTDPNNVISDIKSMVP